MWQSCALYKGVSGFQGLWERKQIYVSGCGFLTGWCALGQAIDLPDWINSKEKRQSCLHVEVGSSSNAYSIPLL